MGIEDDDSDKFVIELGAGALGTQPALEMETSGGSAANITMNGGLTVNDSTSIAADLSVTGNVTLAAAKAIGYSMTSNAAHAVGSVLFFNSSGKAAVADADAIASGRVMGIAMEAASGADQAKLVCTIVGSILDVEMDSARDSSALERGMPIYLSGTAGKATPVAPTGAGDQVVRIGFAFEAGDGVSTARQIIFQPQYIGTVN